MESLPHSVVAAGSLTIQVFPFCINFSPRLGSIHPCVPPHPPSLHTLCPLEPLIQVSFSFIHICLTHCSPLFRPQDKSPGSSAIAVLGLTLALMTSLLVPVDVFLVSYMKNSDGSWKPWAESEEVRESLKSSLLWAYYAAYGVGVGDVQIS